MLAAAIQKQKMQAHPLTKLWQKHGGWNAVVYYHNRICSEMIIRGYREQTPLFFQQELHSRHRHLELLLPPITEAMIQTDIEDLLCRWELRGQHGRPREAIPDRATKVEAIFTVRRPNLNQGDQA